MVLRFIIFIIINTISNVHCRFSSEIFLFLGTLSTNINLPYTLKNTATLFNNLVSTSFIKEFYIWITLTVSGWLGYRQLCIWKV